MRRLWKCLAGVVLSIGASSAPGGLVVTSYFTAAQTYGYAPVSQTQYFAEQWLNNVSPAVAEVSGDWTGPNANGTPDTWHYVGNSRVNTTTMATPASFAVGGAGAFAYTLDTTPNFIDPRSVSTYGPGGTAQYNAFFEIDTPAAYSITVQLNEHSSVRLKQIGGPEVFHANTIFLPPGPVSLSGTIGPGRYTFLAAADFGVTNLTGGVHRVVDSGSFENLTLRVQIPEPTGRGLLIGAFGSFLFQRRSAVRRFGA